MGALTISSRSVPQFVGLQKMVTAVGTPSATYATGGETTTAAAFGLSRIDQIECEAGVTSSGTTGYVCRWNGSRTAPKIIYYSGAAAGTPLAEETNADNLSTFPVRLRVYGI